MRRVGKSYLLFELFANRLRAEGTAADHIVKINLEDRRNNALRNPDNLLAYIDAQIKDSQMHYILLDEVQMVAEFEDVLNSYLHVPNADVYVTGSNARFLSKDVITEFRGRGDEMHVYPLSFREFVTTRDTMYMEQTLGEYMQYGGLPQVATIESPQERKDYLQQLFLNTYLRDIKERYEILLDSELEDLVDMVASGIGGLTNPLKIQNTFRSVKQSKISSATIKQYLDYMQDAFLIRKAIRYDVKGRKYIETPAKYYFEDLGLRNARLNFRQTEQTHLMENLLFNELCRRGYSVDVGQVSQNTRNAEGKSVRQQMEVDFVCNEGYQRVYIQSAFALPTQEKREQELRSLRLIHDNFRKVVITGGLQPTYQDEDGILMLNIYDFLLDKVQI